jgi:hypothetical protein
MVETQKAYKPKVKERAVPKQNRRISQIKINDHVFTLQTGSAAQERRMIANRTHSGWRKVYRQPDGTFKAYGIEELTTPVRGKFIQPEPPRWNPSGGPPAPPPRRSAPRPGARGPVASKQAGPGSPLKPHQVREPDVADFVKDSKVKDQLYHASTKTAVASIKRSGPDLSKSTTNAYGRGFYLATKHVKRYGASAVKAAADLRNPLDVDLDEFEPLMSRWGVDVNDPEQIRNAVLARGHDGLILRRADLDDANNFVDFVVIMKEETMRVIVP